MTATIAPVASLEQRRAQRLRIQLVDELTRLVRELEQDDLVEVTRIGGEPIETVEITKIQNRIDQASRMLSDRRIKQVLDKTSKHKGDLPYCRIPWGSRSGPKNAS